MVRKGVVKKAIEKSGKSIDEIARELYKSKYNLISKIKRDIFSLAELIKLGEVIGAEFEFSFVDKNDKRYRGTTMKEMIPRILRADHKTVSGYAEKLGVSRQSLQRKWCRDRLKIEDLDKVAEYTGMSFVSGFRFNDGTFIH